MSPRRHRYPLLGLALFLIATGASLTAQEAPVAGAGEVGTVEVWVGFVGEVPEAGVPVKLHLASIGGGSGGSEPAALEQTAVAPGEVTLRLPSPWTWRLVVQAPGFWAPEVVVPTLAPSPEEGLIVRLHPTTRLSGEIRLEPGVDPPEVLEVWFARSPPRRSAGGRKERDPPLEGRLRCPLGPDPWECDVPAAVVDLQIRAPGFVPHYFWGVQLGQGRTHPLGGITLEAGASISGWVEAADRGAGVADCQVRLAPAAAGIAQDRATTERLARLERGTTTGERGFFQLAGLAPGSYEVVATCPGLASARRSPIEVLPGLESQLIEPIVVSPPSRIEVELVPPEDPYGRPWRLLLVEIDPEGRPRAFTPRSLEPAPGGRWWESDLPPGRYRLTVLDEDQARWVEREVAIYGEVARELVEVPVLEVRGTIQQGDDPVTGELWFGGTRGPRRVVMAADLDGRFEGFLPGEGRWHIELVEPGDGGQRLSLDPVEVRRAPDRSYARLALRIPDTRLEGEVVDEAGKPVPGAEIRLRGSGEERSPSFGSTDEDGQFVLRGIPAGAVVVWAVDETRSSDWAPVSLSEGVAPPELRLVLRSQRRVGGEVWGDGRPVAGARILALPLFGGSAGASLGQTLSGPAGTFELELPATVAAAVMVVAAPGYAVRLLRVDLDQNVPLRVLLEREGGSLALHLGEPAGDRPAATQGFLIHGGAFVPIGVLAMALPPHFRNIRNPWLVLDNVAMGQYAYCTGAAAVRAFTDGRHDPPESGCATGFLLPFARLELRPPS